MAGYLNDIKNVDVVLTGTFGSFTVRNYGSNAASITLSSTDNKLYNIQEGAYGDMLMNKSYKAKNMRLKINVLRKSSDYSRLKAIVALELAGEAVLFTSFVKDNNSGESGYCAQSVMETNPDSIWGVNPEDNVEFSIIMPSTVYVAPAVA